ncbi:MAG TPA: hypothetical protein VMR65_01255 [Candidatus Sulfotelmatobacter sp.]|jgi:hypothetical protein|nr:hypothetical protein [Candidatus Sulfotelmatobacter sp.]
MEAYAVPAVVEYLQVAFSFVRSVSVVCVVVDGKLPEGNPLERTGGVESAPVEHAAPVGGQPVQISTSSVYQFVVESCWS